MGKVSFVKGSYTWRMVRMRAWGKRRWVIFIYKGMEVVAAITYHPGAKQLALSPKTDLTLPLIQYVAHLMDPLQFRTLAELHAAESRKREAE